MQSLIERLERRYPYSTWATRATELPAKIEVVSVSAVPPHINPDGPEAAALIRELVTVLKSIKGVGPLTRDTIQEAIAKAQQL